MRKVFGIGLSHTGTKSLNAALNLLEIRSVHWPRDRVTCRELSMGSFPLTLLNFYQAITDITTVPFYPQLDKAYPGSKFILSMREKTAWLASMKKVNERWLKLAQAGFLERCRLRLCENFRRYGLGTFRATWRQARQERAAEFIRIAAYGAVAFQDEERLSYVYDVHHRNAAEYFRNRPGDLLVMDICAGEGWEKLCPFLAKPIPGVSFPRIADEKRCRRLDAGK